MEIHDYCTLQTEHDFKHRSTDKSCSKSDSVVTTQASIQSTEQFAERKQTGNRSSGTNEHCSCQANKCQYPIGHSAKYWDKYGQTGSNTDHPDDRISRRLLGTHQILFVQRTRGTRLGIGGRRWSIQHGKQVANTAYGSWHVNPLRSLTNTEG